MAIDQTPYPDTEDLVNVKSKRFWPAQIPVAHWQLRHFISSPEPNHLYYGAGAEVFCLNTLTKQHRLIAKLPFDARCTASGYGWVCVGGETEGNCFAAIRLDGSGPRSLDVDAALPIDTWRGTRRSPSVRVERVGEQIVNSISIHRIQDEEAHLDDIVAVLTNNDKTVRVFSLPLNIEAYTMVLPHPVNHATISPDGKTMVVVGDLAQAFFYSRHIKTAPPQIPKPHNRLTSVDVEWKLVREYDLYVTSKAAPQGYFTTAWSPDGRLVAVGSEDGYITVFSAEKVVKPDVDSSDAVVTIIASSRAVSPNPHPGAVRAMMFSPAPWDLLIWAEDRDRVCISDLRSGLRGKQILVLDPKEKDLVSVAGSEVLRDGARTPDSFDRLFSETQRDLDHMEAEFLRRNRERGLESTYGYAPSYVEARRWDRARLGARHRSGYTDDPQGLNAREQQILDTLRESRQRQEAHSAGSGINYTHPDLLSPHLLGYRAADDGGVPSLVQTNNDSPRPRSGDAGVASALPAMNGTQDILDDHTVTLYDPRDFRAAFSRYRSANLRDDTSTTQSRSRTTLGDQDTPSSSTSSSHRSTRVRTQRSSMFLPTPPSSQPAIDSSTPDTAGGTAARSERHPNEDEDDNDEGDDSDEEDEQDDVWRNLDEATSSTRGPLFEYAARAQAELSAAQAAVARTQAAREEREFRQRYLIRQRERLREAREEAAASLSRANDYAALPTLSRTRAVADDMDYETLLRRRAAGYGHEGVRTAGIAMSADGSTLWAACEDGIFEFEVNRKARMFWPAIEPR